jgi:TPR repeat protein
MPTNLISCISLPTATISSVPISDYAEANEELAKMGMEVYMVCCGKSICQGCAYSFRRSGIGNCPFCKTERIGKTDEEEVEEIRRRVEANDPVSIHLMADNYNHGSHGIQQDHVKAIELFTKSAELGSSEAHCQLGNIYRQGGDLKKAKLHYENAAIAGHEIARYMLGEMEIESGNMERAVKHCTISASAGCYSAMYVMITLVKKGYVSRESIDSTLAAYNNSCVK